MGKNEVIPQQLFSTLVYETKLLTARSRLQKDILAETEQIEAFDEEGVEWSATHYPEGFTSYATRNDLHYFSSTFRELEEEIRPHVYAFADKLEYDLRGIELRMTDCWLNIMRRGSVHTSHIHPMSFISGTYYVQVPKGASGIQFEDPRLSSFMATPPKKERCSLDQKHFVQLKPKTGHLVLFESWLRHEVPPLTVDEERMSVSFNYSWDSVE